MNAKSEIEYKIIVRRGSIIFDKAFDVLMYQRSKGLLNRLLGCPDITKIASFDSPCDAINFINAIKRKTMNAKSKYRVIETADGFIAQKSYESWERTGFEMAAIVENWKNINTYKCVDDAIEFIKEIKEGVRDGNGEKVVYECEL